MDSVQFKNIGVNNSQNIHQVNRKQDSAVTNPAVTRTAVPEFRPASYTTPVTIRTTLATKDEKKK